MASSDENGRRPDGNCLEATASARDYLAGLAGAFFSSTNLMPNFPLLSRKPTHSDAASQPDVCFWPAGWNRYEPGPSLTSGFPGSPWIHVPEMTTSL